LNNLLIVNSLLSLSNQDVTACLTNCSNNGVCELDPATQKLFCSCNQHFTGSKCNIDTRPCSYGPCLNNATCINTNSTTLGYTCECNGFYTGNNCETQIDLCQNETCSSNGKCSVVDNKAKCKCFQYYSGDNCQNMDQSLVTIKNIISTASIIAITLIISFYFLIILSDLSKYVFCNKEDAINYKKYQNHHIYKVKYINFKYN
jgi:hypothetical protein